MSNNYEIENKTSFNSKKEIIYFLRKKLTDEFSKKGLILDAQDVNQNLTAHLINCDEKEMWTLAEYTKRYLSLIV